MKTVDELEAAWNAQADRMNSWDELGVDEIVYFAQEELCREIGIVARRLAVDSAYRHRASEDLLRISGQRVSKGAANA